MRFDQTIFPQHLKEHVHIVLSKVPADAEFSNDLIDNRRLSGTLFEECEDSRSDEIKVEHLTLPDVQDDCAILSVRAAHCVGDFIHLESPKD